MNYRDRQMALSLSCSKVSMPPALLTSVCSKSNPAHSFHKRRFNGCFQLVEVRCPCARQAGTEVAKVGAIVDMAGGPLTPSDQATCSTPHSATPFSSSQLHRLPVRISLHLRRFFNPRPLLAAQDPNGPLLNGNKLSQPPTT